jgi:hypothetical protein
VFCVLSILVAKATVLEKREWRMTWAIRSCALAAGAAALLSTQAVYAAPVSSHSTGVDPLVSLSVLGTSQSRGAVCSGATFGAKAAASTACGIPVTAAAAAAAAATAQDYSDDPKPIGVLPLIIGLVVIGGLIALILSSGGDSEGNLTPVSPN